MPTLGLLTRRFSEALAVDEKTVKVFVRSLREEGWLTTGARGVNAPDMTFLDAARILIALVVTDKPSVACDAVNDFGSLVLSPREKSGLHEEGDRFEAITTGNKLEDYVGALIQVYAQTQGLADFMCELRIVPTLATAQINFDGNVYVFSHLGKLGELYSPAYYQEMDASRKVLSRWHSGIQVERYVRTIAIDDIAAAFRTGGASK